MKPMFIIRIDLAALHSMVDFQTSVAKLEKEITIIDESSTVIAGGNYQALIDAVKRAEKENGVVIIGGGTNKLSEALTLNQPKQSTEEIERFIEAMSKVRNPFVNDLLPKPQFGKRDRKGKLVTTQWWDRKRK